MKRHEWTFKYSGTKLAEAARHQLEFRISRIAAWEAKKEEVMAQIRESGMTIKEDLAAHMLMNTMKYSATNQNSGPQIVIDQTMQDNLNECFQKINEHKGLEKQYSAWVQVFEANPEAHLDLHQDDWIFFFGK
jgi:hypothetical protein